ncbi:UBP1-associated protein 2C-like [Rhododendron vialii]|uniref:UBP1-associated protein 2C-like n=1 Tax=Rhododendron vialii TaxID=182163 RepID=UPI00265DC48F|nr:UBP1-associated protein 2C-like [Rhododendron vialii]XP_058199194.1 UBP1-associated protein 2C-like [Rhododendron vialii]XP_058199202.1 UBP1-associated protein 2C-like [Rhododendron vialii]XP_058199211.1 UBP1-associated protein 2C-like [Rhododendron vialii]XP_058199217.1 UBP1-associated protein 2C-like [Rhododendron vialii]
MEPSKKRKADENGASSPTPSPLLTSDDARKLLEPLTHDHLLQILAPALLCHPDLLSSARSLADPDPSRRKLFVRGLGPDTTTDKLRSLFSSHGPIDEAVVITDKNTGKSKGYGFVTYKHVDGAILALKEPSKKIDGRMTVTQLAAVGVSATGAADVAARKIYVGNVPFEISAERLLGHFLAYGEVEEGPLGFDKSTGKAKGFAFFIYKSEEGARASLVDPAKNIDGHQVTCKLAVDGGKKAVIKSVTGPNNGVDSNRVGGSMPNSSYGGPGGGGYGGFTGAPPPMMAHQNLHSNSPLPPSSGGGPGFGNQGPPLYGGGGGGGGVGGYGGGFGGGQYGGPASGEYGGLSNAGSFGNRVPPSSVGMPSGGYPESGGNYGLSSSGFPTPLNQPSSGPRGPPGGMYQGMPPYY